MMGGDMASVGEKGFNLSGGQRARLALARSVYHGAEIYLLDDILSAVDAHVGCSILHNAILGPLMNQQTRILCTHNIQAISAADLVIVMNKGQVQWVGHPTEFSCRRVGDMKMAYLATYFGLEQQTHRSLDDVRMNLEVLKYCGTVLLLESSLPEIFTENSWVSPNAITRRESHSTGNGLW